MTVTGNLLENNTLTALSHRAGAHITSAIKKASLSTGVNFAYLMKQAAAESSFNAKAEAKTSSAAGLYQFIESTWLQMVKNHGEKHGLSGYADKIDDKGRVSDKALKQEILALRKNPEKAALLAAEFAAENQSYLEKHLDKGYGDIGSTELYFAHFLGAGSATAFLNAYKDNPLIAAADMFPKAARANRNVFYDRETGEPRTLAGVYDFFDRKFNAEGSKKTLVAAADRQTAPKAPTSRNLSGQTLQILMAEQDVQRSDGLRRILGPEKIETGRPDDQSGTKIYWHSDRIDVKSFPVVSPTGIMLMAKLDLPMGEERTAKDKEQRHAHNFSYANRYNG